MGLITLAQAAAWCGGKVEEQYKEITFTGANNDSRKILPGQLFVALEGERDGHDFIPMAMEKGAAAVLCSRPVESVPSIVVVNPRIALGEIAMRYRKSLPMKVVGVTGSVGKSTTKEMIACVLESKFKVAKTPANHNNDIGMPMAVLSIPADTEVAVLEMGMNHFREIEYLSYIARPDYAVIINIGTMHIEHLGSQEGILKAKLEILDGMSEDGKLLFNGDDTLLWGVRDRLGRPVTYFGAKNDGCAVCGKDVTLGVDGISFAAETQGEKIHIRLPLEGEHYVADALAAVSVGLAMGVEPQRITDSLASFRNLAGRQEILSVNGYTIIKDCYNAGPESMSAALKVLGSKPGRHIAVLGDMLELGVCAQAEHYRVGRVAAENADVVLSYGENANHVVSGCITGGMKRSNAVAFTDRAQLVSALKHVAKQGDVLLFKGSHGMHMELALEMFLKDET